MKRAFVWLLALSLLPLLTAFHWPWQSAGDPERIEWSGTVEAREVDLAFQVSGRIAGLTVDEGDTVKTEQLVATLDASNYELALRNATAQMEAALAVLAALQAGTRVQELRVWYIETGELCQTSDPIGRYSKSFPATHVPLPR